MKNAMQLKALIKNISLGKHISAQLVMQNYMLERFLERVSISKYRTNFILKGGFLIAAIVGLNSRATMDMEVTIKGLPVSEQSITQMVKEICSVKLDDEITFLFKQISEIREGDEYSGYRVSLDATYPPMAVPVKLDITTGDKITPREASFEYKLLFENRSISIMAYNVETVMAEKIETIISRGDQNTRPRDYYDIYILQKLRGESINVEVLKNALIATAEKRNSLKVLERYNEVLTVVSGNIDMQMRWLNYQKDFDYARDILFVDTCRTAKDILDNLFLPG